MNNTLETAVFGGGCFWCTEAVFSELKGVNSVLPGYAGGGTPNPTYESVCSGTTGHAEVIEIKFDPSIISYDDLLTVFFAVHDPTTRNRQGNDIGTQYRSIILTTTPEQEAQAKAFIKNLNTPGEKEVITEVVPLEKFFPAEEYHREYFKHHPEQAYCQLVINPKIEKLQEKFQQLLNNK